MTRPIFIVPGVSCEAGFLAQPEKSRKKERRDRERREATLLSLVIASGSEAISVGNKENHRAE